VCNAGVTTGASRESLLSTFESYGGRVANVILIPDKSFSFVSMASAEEAAAAVSAINGLIPLKATDEPPLACSESRSHAPSAPPAPPAPPLLAVAISRLPPALALAAEASLARWLRCPPGLHLIEDFISPEEEQLLLDSVEWPEQGHSDNTSCLKQRRVAHFGHDFVYGANAISAEPNNRPFPACWTFVLARAEANGWLPEWPDQCTANLYLPGQGIPPHVDSHQCCGERIASLSLGDDVVMTFTPLDMINAALINDHGDEGDEGKNDKTGLKY
jgi:alkylated DNA repair protein alkB family protein 8